MDQDQTAQNVQFDLDLHRPIKRCFPPQNDSVIYTYYQLQTFM